MPTINEHLATALADESQSYFKFMAYARKAEQECLPQIAKLFRAAAAAKAIQALENFENMRVVGTTLQNLEAAEAGQSHLFKEVYPPIVEQATAEGHKARTMLGYAWTLAAASYFRQALDATKAGNDLPEGELYLCPYCGHIEFGVPQGKCPVCGEPAEYYRKVA